MIVLQTLLATFTLSFKKRGSSRKNIKIPFLFSIRLLPDEFSLGIFRIIKWKYYNEIQRFDKYEIW